MSCADFIDAGNLAIHEYVEFPECAFAAISYVWQGNTPGDLFDERAFNVPVSQDAAPGDPIGIEVLHDACVAAMARGARSYLHYADELDGQAVADTNDVRDSSALPCLHRRPWGYSMPRAS